jgi:hypothetical protein
VRRKPGAHRQRALHALTTAEKLIARLKELQAQRPSYETLLLKLGAAKSEAGRDWSHIKVHLPQMLLSQLHLTLLEQPPPKIGDR